MSGEGPGSRLRRARLDQGRRQAAVARDAGISASYLNLIEHGRRPAGGAVLDRLAGALGLDRAALSGEADRALVATLESAGAAAGMGKADRAGAAEVAWRFPAWAALVAAQARDAALDGERIAALADLPAQDTAFGEALHEVLSCAASVRATASILAGTADLDAAWLERFHRSLDAESRRLAAGADALVAHLDRRAARPAARSPLAQAAVGDAAPEAAAIAAVHGRRDREDEAALPGDACLAAPPAAVAAERAVPVALVLRRLAALDPGRLLLVVDAAGAVLRCDAPPGFPVAAMGPGCALWPVFEAFRAPLQPLRRTAETPDGALWQVDAVAEPAGRSAHGPIFEATMIAGLLDADGESRRALDPPVPVGPGCRTCPRARCPARREPSVFAEGAEAGQTGGGRKD